MSVFKDGITFEGSLSSEGLRANMGVWTAIPQAMLLIAVRPVVGAFAMFLSVPLGHLESSPAQIRTRYRSRIPV